MFGLVEQGAIPDLVAIVDVSIAPNPGRLERTSTDAPGCLNLALDITFFER